MIIDKVKRLSDNIIIKMEGGYQTSLHARKIAKKNNVEVGLYSYGGCFQEAFNTGGSVSIGKYTSIGPNVKYFGANHPMNYVSMTPYLYSKEWVSKIISGGGDVQDIKRFHLDIGHDCWIGYGTIITCGCKKIGNGAVIGAGSVVTKDIMPYSIVVGNPAHVIKYRFDKEIIDLLEESRWYQLTPQELLKYYDYRDAPERFAKEIINYVNMKAGGKYKEEE